VAFGCLSGDPFDRPWPNLTAGREPFTNDEGPLSGPLRLRMFRRRPTLPPRLRGSTIGAGGLNFRVRNGTGCSPSAMATETVVPCGWTELQRSRHVHHHGNDRGCEPPEDPELDSEREQKPSPRPISTGRLNTLPCLHLRPIYLVVSEGPYSMKDGRPHLGASFALRCFQRLSLPYVANQPCRWRDNWHTRGTSAPVLSYWGQLPSSLLRPRRIGTELSHAHDPVLLRVQTIPSPCFQGPACYGIDGFERKTSSRAVPSTRCSVRVSRYGGQRTLATQMLLDICGGDPLRLGMV
jgi:hypothetical protein